MQIKKIEFVEEITDIHCDTIDVYVKAESDYISTVVGGTPQHLIAEMDQIQTDFIDGRTSTIFVKKLTQKIVD